MKWNQIYSAPDATWVLVRGGKMAMVAEEFQPSMVVAQWDTINICWAITWYDGGYPVEYINPSEWSELP